MEQSVLLSLNFELCATSSLTYLHRYSGIDRSEEKVLFLARYLIEECFIHYKICEFTQHEIACSGYYLAKKFYQLTDCWPASLEQVSGFKETDLKVCSRCMYTSIKKSRANQKLSSVKRKFSTEEFMNVSLLPELNSS
jgi:hypothetical protein